MKIHATKLLRDQPTTQPTTKPVAQALVDCAAPFLPDRLVDQGRVRLRLRLGLENYRARNGRYALNGVAMGLGRAPVRVADDRPAAEIRIAQDECFGESTACLYGPGSSDLLSQDDPCGPCRNGSQQMLRHRSNGVCHGHE